MALQLDGFSGSYVIYPGALKSRRLSKFGPNPFLWMWPFRDRYLSSQSLCFRQSQSQRHLGDGYGVLELGSVCLLALGFALYRWTNRGGLPRDPVQHAQDCQNSSSLILDEHARAVAMSKIVRQYIADMSDSPHVMTLSPNELQEWLIKAPPSIVHVPPNWLSFCSP